MTEGHNGTNWLSDLMSNRPFIVGLLFLGTYFVPILVLIAVPLTFVFRNRPEEEWEESHFDYLLRTALIAVLITLVFGLVVFTTLLAFGDFEDSGLFVVSIGLVGAGLIFALCGVRILISLMKSASRVPMKKPKTWWF